MGWLGNGRSCRVGSTLRFSVRQRTTLLSPVVRGDMANARVERVETGSRPI